MAVMATAALLQRGFWQWSNMATTAGDGQLEYGRKVDCMRLPDKVH